MRSRHVVTEYQLTMALAGNGAGDVTVQGCNISLLYIILSQPGLCILLGPKTCQNNGGLECKMVSY